MSDHCSILPGETLIHLHGSDIAGFLQGQLTCDTNELGEGRTISGALCNPKGRVLADMRAWQIAPDHVALRVRRTIAESCAATLATYARFSRIECTVDQGDWAVIGLWRERQGDEGDSVTPVAGDRVAGLLAEGDLHGMTGSTGIFSARSGSSRWELLAPSNRLDDVAQRLNRTVEPIAAHAEHNWRGSELLDGLYRIDEGDIGRFTPQALNYDRMDMVSFSKGCYTGQEVVARLHYKGKSKKRLAVLQLTPGDLGPIEYDAKVTAVSGEALGEVLRVEGSGETGSVVACLLNSDVAAAGTVVLGGQLLPLAKLPYGDDASAV